MNPEFLIPIVVVPTVFGFILAIGPFRKPLTRWLHRKADGDDGPGLHAEMAEQAERLADTERRMAELEERLDFAERLLSRGRAESPPRSTSSPPS
jgi:hypothetical protein